MWYTRDIGRFPLYNVEKTVKFRDKKGEEMVRRHMDQMKPSTEKEERDSEVEIGHNSQVN